MTIVNEILTRNPCYKAGRKITPSGIMLHSVGCAQPNAKVFTKAWNSESYGSACVHAFIDANDGTVYQTLPWNYRGWHCGASANNTHIGVEMCEPSTIKYKEHSSIFTVLDKDDARKAAVRTYESAVELFAQLCLEYNLDPMAPGVIISHNEGRIRGIASGHYDPEHLWNGLELDYTMGMFRNDVYKRIVNADNDKKDLSFIVRIDISNLNIRKGPGINYGLVGSYTGKGIFTIVKISTGDGSKNGWGLLKSYASNSNGWVALDYCKFL